MYILVKHLHQTTSYGSGHGLYDHFCGKQLTSSTTKWPCRWEVISIPRSHHSLRSHISKPCHPWRNANGNSHAVIWAGFAAIFRQNSQLDEPMELQHSRWNMVVGRRSFPYFWGQCPNSDWPMTWTLRIFPLHLSQWGLASTKGVCCMTCRAKFSTCEKWATLWLKFHALASNKYWQSLLNSINNRKVFCSKINHPSVRKNIQSKVRMLSLFRLSPGWGFASGDRRRENNW